MIAVTRYSKSFAAEVDLWVQAAVQQGARDLATLVSVLPGVYPTEVLGSIRRLAQRGVLPAVIESAVAQSAQPTTFLSKLRLGPSSLPVPHPLDFDWRFTPRTASRIVDSCKSLGGTLICIGAPSVYSEATSRRLFSDKSLIDRNGAVIRHFADSSSQVFRCDVLSDPVPVVRADVVVIDPPWYPEHFRSFLWSASEMCELGGNVLVSLPMIGTRPRMQEQLDDILEWARTLGFALQLLDEGALAYETPHFERNALLAAGVVLPFDSWRRGTLCVLKKERITCVQRPLSSKRSEQKWDEATLYGTRMYFRKNDCIGFDDPPLITILPGDILPSVSRTHRLRPIVDVWTSGNRIFRCKSPRVLRSVAQALSRGEDLSTISRRFPQRLPPRLIDQIARSLHDLAQQERWERQSIGIG